MTRLKTNATLAIFFFHFWKKYHFGYLEQKGPTPENDYLPALQQKQILKRKKIIILFL